LSFHGGEVSTGLAGCCARPPSCKVNKKNETIAANLLRRISSSGASWMTLPPASMRHRGHLLTLCADCQLYRSCSLHRRLRTWFVVLHTAFSRLIWRCFRASTNLRPRRPQRVSAQECTKGIVPSPKLPSLIPPLSFPNMQAAGTPCYRWRLKGDYHGFTGCLFCMFLS
jgi:hypothetical protein